MMNRLEAQRLSPKQEVRAPNLNVRHPPKPANFGGLLKKYRLRAGYSQAYLAEKARVSPETIGALERGVRRAPYSDTLEFLIDALDLSGDERLAIETAAADARGEVVAQKRERLGATHNIPLQLTPLVGRDGDIARLRALVAENRLVTVTGPSGVGKTRVALEVAVRYAESRNNEARLVDFAALGPNGSVRSKIASALGVPSMGEDPILELEASLRARNLLLVFDSCEHVISEVAEIALTLLRTCPGVRLLVASDVRIGAVGETLFRLPPLSFPDHKPETVDEARAYSAIALFIQRAEFEANFVVNADNLTKVVEICRRLDGVPRGIELAAARLAALGLRDLHLRLNEHFVITGGGHDLPARKKTPLEGVGWSYNGLTQVEQTLLRRLSVFSVSHTLEDAEAVCVAEDVEPERVAEILESLVHKSLVVVYRASVTRYRVLDVVRSYCLERLSESGELARLSEKYAQWCEKSRVEARKDFL